MRRQAARSARVRRTLGRPPSPPVLLLGKVGSRPYSTANECCFRMIASARVIKLATLATDESRPYRLRLGTRPLLLRSGGAIQRGRTRALGRQDAQSARR